MLKQDEALDKVFKALADGNRRRIVERLGDGPASVSDLAKPLPMTLAAVVQHVQVLEGAGLVRTWKTGRVRRCEINPDSLRQVDRWISERKAMWEQAFERLGEVLAESDDEPPTEEK